MAEKVTSGLAECDSSLLLCLWLGSLVGWLPKNWISSCTYAQLLIWDTYTREQLHNILSKMCCMWWSLTTHATSQHFSTTQCQTHEILQQKSTVVFSFIITSRTPNISQSHSGRHLSVYMYI